LKLPAKAATINPIKKITDAVCIDLSILLENFGNLIPTNIPKITGIPRIKNTVRNISNGSIEIGTNRGECFAYSPPQKAKLNGVIIRLITVVIVVRLTDNVTFALEIEEIRLDTFPPGHAATNIIPSATGVEGRIINTSKYVSAGKITYCATAPMTTGLGFKKTVLKCPGLILNATPNMMKAMARFIIFTLS
jgi:hypothetical protein